MTTLLLVEDDDSLALSLQERLSREGYRVLRANSCETAQELCRTEKAELAILDIGLPDGDGFALARALQEQNPDLPFVFLTAMNSAEFRLEGYEIGADEFIPKPFHLKELLLRLERVLAKHRIPKTVQCENFSLHPESLEISFLDGRREFVQPKDFELLMLLVNSSPAAVGRDEILERVWKGSGKSNARTIDNAIVRLRTALGEIGKRNLRSVRGVGYQWHTPDP